MLHGKTIGQWAAKWWHWQEKNYPDYSFGDGLVDCSLGQSGPVWYLGGTGTVGGSAERECDSPITGRKHLMFPLVNVIWHNEDEEDLSVEEKREVLDGILSEEPAGILNSTACLLQAEVDGFPVVYSEPIVRTQTPPFAYAEDPKSVGDGFWVVLSPLPIGDHTIHFTGGFCDIESGDALFSVDVAYNLTIGFGRGTD
jgi:hypothetical protein